MKGISDVHIQCLHTNQRRGASNTHSGTGYVGRRPTARRLRPPASYSSKVLRPIFAVTTTYHRVIWMDVFAAGTAVLLNATSTAALYRKH